MVEARPKFGVKKAAKSKAPVGGQKKKGKKGKGDGLSEEQALANFERDMALALAASRVYAGLADPLDDYVPQHDFDEEPQVHAALEVSMQAHQEEENKEPAHDPVPDDNREVEFDAECAICMLLLMHPTKLPCRHVFCHGCAKASLDFKWECPMCRHRPPRAFNFAVCKEIADRVKAEADPEIFEARLKQVGLPAEVVRQQKAAADAQQQAADAEEEAKYAGDLGYELEIRYGNKHRLINNAPVLKNGRIRNHEWTCYVQLNKVTRVKPQDIFKRVQFTLPQCYANRYREVVSDGTLPCRNAKSWFECKEAGWGTVNVQIEIDFKDDLGYPMRPIRLQHMTNFSPQGGFKIHKVRIPRDLAEQLRLIIPVVAP